MTGNAETDHAAAAATAILAEALRQAVRRREESPPDEKQSHSTEPKAVRTEAIQVSRAVLRSLRKLPLTDDVNLTRPYRSAIANVAAGYFWQPRARPDDVIKALDTVPIPSE
ncbi:hypothetical protein [Amycolatopsis sp. WGS_07]|uniref:hypothetical protein n=1 Tax=Amycolatopsis sp. WGS_07 TaxID=3076764 RepID=UPI003872F9A0